MHNNVVIINLSDDVADDQIEKAVIKIVADVDVTVEACNIKTCHRFS